MSRGRRKGDLFPTRKADPIVMMSESFRVKINPTCLIVQEKGELNEDEVIDELKILDEDKGWGDNKYVTNWSDAAEVIFNKLYRKKARKEKTMDIEKFYKIFQKTEKEVREMFKAVDFTDINK
jgi:hypothetical protein